MNEEWNMKENKICILPVDDNTFSVVLWSSFSWFTSLLCFGKVTCLKKKSLNLIFTRRKCDSRLVLSFR